MELTGVKCLSGSCCAMKREHSRYSDRFLVVFVVLRI